MRGGHPLLLQPVQRATAAGCWRVCASGACPHLAGHVRATRNTQHGQDGTKVVVKVQYPEVERYFKLDLATIKVLINTVKFFDKDKDAYLELVYDTAGSCVPRQTPFVPRGSAPSRGQGPVGGQGEPVLPALRQHTQTRRRLPPARVPVQAAPRHSVWP